MNNQLPDGITSNIPWRRAGVKYASNEIFFDMLEEIDATIDSQGRVVTTGVVRPSVPQSVRRYSCCLVSRHVNSTLDSKHGLLSVRRAGHAWLSCQGGAAGDAVDDH